MRNKLVGFAYSVVFALNGFVVFMMTMILTSRMGGSDVYARIPMTFMVISLIVCGGTLLFAAFLFWKLELSDD